MGMFDYDTSTPGIQSMPGGTWIEPDGSWNLGEDKYLDRKQRQTQFIAGATPQQLYRAAKNYQHSMAAVRDMFHYQHEAGQRGSKGMFLGLQDGTSNDWDKGMNVLDLAYSLYEKGYDTKQINDIMVGDTGKFKDVGPASGIRGYGGWHYGHEVGEGFNPGFNPNAMPGAPMMGYINTNKNKDPESNAPAQRRERQGVWGSGYKDGGYGMLSPENDEMRKAIVGALEEKLLG